VRKVTPPGSACSRDFFDCYFSIREIIARFDQPIGRVGVGSKGRKHLEQIPSDLADGMVEWPI
jgi:hypothetical protein